MEREISVSRRTGYRAACSRNCLARSGRYFVFAIVALLLICCVNVNRTFAQASLLSEDIIDDITVKPGGDATKAYSVTVVRDAFQRDQWYYVPNAPRLVERDIQGKKFPEFALVKYQYDDPAHPGQLLEGAILQFAVNLAIPSEEIDQIRTEIPKRNKPGVTPAAIRLAAMPIKSATVALYVPGPNPGDPASFLQATPNGTGIAPTFASQKMVFSVPLTQVGANIYDALTRTGGTGVPIAVILKYNGTTPPAGFKVTVDYDQLYHHYSQNSVLALEASYFGWFGGSYRRDSSSVYNDLVTNNDIKVEVITGETFDLAKAQEYLSPILNQINQNLLEVLKPPATVDPAKAQPGNKGGFFGGANYAVAIKDETHRKHGRQTWEMNVRSVIERQTLASGFVGIQNYDADTQKQLVFFAPNTFQNSVFILPQIAFNNSDDISDATLTIEARGGSPEKQLITKTARWVAANGWTVGGTAAPVINFGLGGYGLSLDDQKKAKFIATMSVNFSGGNRSPYTYTETVNAFNGSIPVASPANRVNTVEIDSSFLPWGGGMPSPKLLGLQIKIVSGSRTSTALMRQQLNNGVLSPPKPFFWLVGSEGNDPVNAELTFIFENGRRVPWSQNGNLRGPNRTTQILVTQGDVPPAQ